MKNFLIAFAVFMLWSLFGLWLYSSLNFNSNTAKVIDAGIKTTLKTNSESGEKDDLLDENKVMLIITMEDSIFITQDIFITKNSPEIIMPKMALSFKYQLKTYLLEHPDQEFHISSLYSPTEHVVSPNLGIQRGKKIKETLTKAGIPSERIVVKPFIKDIQFNADNTFSNSFSFSLKPLDHKRINATKNEIPKARIVYPFSNTGIIENGNLEILLAEIIKIVEENPNINIEVIGHTDNVGNANDNYSMGLQHAMQVRWYLVSKGKIEKEKISVVSKGEAEPIDTNQTDVGRIANRRIEIKFYVNK